MIPVTSRLIRNVYTGPAASRLEYRIPEITLLGQVRVTEMEIRSTVTSEGAFIAILEARLQSTLDDMAAHLIAPTFPVHDLPDAERTA